MLVGPCGNAHFHHGLGATLGIFRSIPPITTILVTDASHVRSLFRALKGRLTLYWPKFAKSLPPNHIERSVEEAHDTRHMTRFS
jgi:hypothetical protein